MAKTKMIVPRPEVDYRIDRTEHGSRFKPA